MTTDLWRDLNDTIEYAALHAERSQQTLIGPSEIGTPCLRKLGYKFAGTPPVNINIDTKWLATIGTAVHAWLEETFTAATTNEDGRWWTERRLNVGTLGGEPISGTCDLYDATNHVVIDHKVVGKTSMEEYRRDGPGDQYRTQAHLYGDGWVNAGYPVERVAILFLPRYTPFRTYLWSEPYDPTVGPAALTRADNVKQLISTIGANVLPLLPTADAHCSYCPWFTPGSTDPTKGCPGDAQYLTVLRDKPNYDYAGIIEPAHQGATK